MKNFAFEMTESELKAAKEEFLILKEKRNSGEQEMIENINDRFCRTFCPRYEFLERVINKEIDPLEKKHGVMIKKYYRSVAGRREEQSEDVRSVTALHDCLEFLLSLEINEDSYKFIDNRIRSIKLDLEISSPSGCLESRSDQEAKERILKRIVLFYIVSCYLMYRVENDLYLVIDQLRKSLVNLKNECEGRLDDEYSGYEMLANLDREEILAEKLRSTEKGRYTQRCIGLSVDFMNNNFHSFFRQAFDSMSYSIILCWLPAISRRIMKMLRIGFQSKCRVDLLSRMYNFNIENILHSFYYKIDEGKVNLKVKNTKNMDFDKITPIGLNERKALKYGNYDFWLCEKTIEIYCEEIVARKRATRRYRSVITEYLRRISFDIFERYQKTARETVKRIKRISEEKFEIYKKTLSKYIKILLYKIFVRQYLIEIIKPQIFSVLCVYDTGKRHELQFSSEGFEVLVESVSLAFFSIEQGLKHNLVIFFTDDEKYCRNNFYQLPNIAFNTTDLGRYKYMKKVRKKKLSEIEGLGGKIEILVRMKKNSGNGYKCRVDDIIENLVSGKEYRDIDIYE